MSASREFLKRILTSQLKSLNNDQMFWAFPVLVGTGWLLWPALDHEWKMNLGLASDPERIINRVQLEKDQRLAAKKNMTLSGSGGSISTSNAKTEEEEDEEEVVEDADNDEEEEEEQVVNEAAAEEEDEDDAPALENDDEEEEDEESEEEPAPPLYMPSKGKNLTSEEIWDTFTIKALRMVCILK